MSGVCQLLAASAWPPASTAYSVADPACVFTASRQRLPRGRASAFSGCFSSAVTSGCWAESVVGGTAEYIALWFKQAGMENGFYWYVTAVIACTLLVYIGTRDTRKHSQIDAEEALHAA